MIFKIQNLYLVLMVLFLVSCQNDNEDIYEDGDTVKMNFSFSPQSHIESDMEHIPMDGTRADQGEIKITNWYRILIAKKIDSKWILDQIIDKKFFPNSSNLQRYYVSDIRSLMSFSVVLNPGEYKMTIFTGAQSVSWNDALKVGATLQDEDDSTSNPIYACTYQVVMSGGGYLNEGSKCLDEEIFAGTKSFVVEKTEDLHSESKVEDNHIELYRKVTKLRIMLKNEVKEDTYQSFYVGVPNAIIANVKVADEKEFCFGLDVWGKPCYQDGMEVTEMKYGVFTLSNYATGSDGSEYLLGMREGSRQLNIYYFMEEGISLPVTISDVNVTAQQGNPIFVYNDETDPIILKYNHITAVAFMPNGDEWEGRDQYGNLNTYLEMDVVSDGGPETPKDLTDVFSYNYEYTPKN